MKLKLWLKIVQKQRIPGSNGFATNKCYYNTSFNMYIYPVPDVYEVYNANEQFRYRYSESDEQLVVNENIFAYDEGDGSISGTTYDSANERLDI